ncbi:MAG: DUF1499 domain-containing protein, partial [Pseudomonadota bacterium]
PEVKTLTKPISVSVMFELSIGLIEGYGLDIVSHDQESGHIEATITTALWGFKDDLVMRIGAGDVEGQTKVDVRSVSRVGESDLGANAKRITKLLNDLSSSE